MLTMFGWHFEIWAVQKYVNLGDLVKSFQRVFTCKNRRRYSRERAPRSLGENYSILFIRVLSQHTLREGLSHVTPGQLKISAASVHQPPVVEKSLIAARHGPRSSTRFFSRRSSECCMFRLGSLQSSPARSTLQTGICVCISAKL